MSTPSRKITGIVAFVVALVTAVALTRFAVTRLTPSEPVAPPIATSVSVAPAAPVNFVVHQSIVDFKRRATYTNLQLERNTNAPAKVWVWTHYFSPDKAGVSWLAPPVAISTSFVGSSPRIVTVTGECPRPMCDRVPRDKDSYYARVFVTDESPEEFQPAFTTRDFDITTATPVLLEDIDPRN